VNPFLKPCSEATKGSLDECEVDEEAASAACLEYSDKLVELQKMIDAQQPAMAALQSMASSVKQVKLAVPKTTVAEDSAQLKEAMAAAKKITEEKGIKSPEAAVAWETVEEIASAGTGNALGGKMTDEECLIDAAAEACAALEELGRVLKMQN
jgi:hypothetical protein